MSEKHPIPKNLHRWELQHFADVKGVDVDTIETRGKPARGYLIVGPPGTGKTCLAAAIVKNWVSRGGDYRFVRWTLASELVFDLVFGGFDHRREALEAACRCSMLVLDDFGSNRVSDNGDALMQMVIDRRFQAGLTTIVTMNVSKAELVKRDSRLASRMEEFEAIVMDGPSLRGVVTGEGT